MQKGEGWNALFWNCHDQPRSVSRFGNDKKYHNESAKMLATAIHMQRGTPYIYQGEEIGMTNNYFDDISQYKDVESINYYHILKQSGVEEKKIYDILKEKSRDNARSPMQWNKDGGFSEAEPWIQMNVNCKKINVEDSIKDKDSILQYYRQLIKLRKEYKIISEGEYYPYLENDNQIYAFKRKYKNEELIVLNNFYADEKKLTIESIEDYKLLIGNYANQELNSELVLRPYESIVLYKK